MKRSIKSTLSLICALACNFASYANQQLQEADPVKIKKTVQGTIDNATERELNANEDPLTELLSKKSVKQNGGHENNHSYEFYSNIYGRYRKIENTSSAWEDNGSRAGISGYYQTDKNSWLFARYELGFNLLDELKTSRYQQPDNNDNAYIFDGESLYTRLAYIGIESGNNIIAYGKSWSTYYQIASFTDRFDSMGGEASGAYNAGTDGGASGTGRADNVLQSRLHLDVFPEFIKLKPLSVNVQIQYGEDIPHVTNIQYGISYGISTIIEAWSDLSFGVAYNYSNLDVNINQSNNHYLAGDVSALLVGGRWFDDNWYIGFTLSKSENLHTTDNQQYFNGIGTEL